MEKSITAFKLVNNISDADILKFKPVEVVRHSPPSAGGYVGVRELTPAMKRNFGLLHPPVVHTDNPIIHQLEQTIQNLKHAKDKQALLRGAEEIQKHTTALFVYLANAK